MKYRVVFFLLAAVVIIIVICNRNSRKETASLHRVEILGKAQGTDYAVTYYDTEARNLKQEIDSLLRCIDMSVSIYEPSSIISLMNNNDPAVIADKIFTDNFILSQKISRATDGAFDITVAPLVEVWGFGLSQRDVVTDIIIDSILQFVGYEKVSLKNHRLVKEDNRLTINFNAIAQGYAVDYIGTYLRSKGITSFLIDVGGEVLASGTKPNDIPWRIAIEKPSDNLPATRDLSDSYVQKYAQVILNISNRAVATSGDYRTFYLNEEGIKVSHTINPKTGKPVDHSLLSATVITDNCAKADAWATAFMVLGADSAKKLLKTNDELEGFLIYSDNNGHTVTYATENIKRQLEEITREK